MDDQICILRADRTLRYDHPSVVGIQYNKLAESDCNKGLSQMLYCGLDETPKNVVRFCSNRLFNGSALSIQKTEKFG